MGVSVSLTITMATIMLRLGDLQQYTQLMERHAEVRISLVFFGVLTAQGAVQGQSLLHDIASFFFKIVCPYFFFILYTFPHKMDQNKESWSLSILCVDAASVRVYRGAEAAALWWMCKPA